MPLSTDIQPQVTTDADSTRNVETPEISAPSETADSSDLDLSLTSTAIPPTVGMVQVGGRDADPRFRPEPWQTADSVRQRAMRAGSAWAASNRLELVAGGAFMAWLVLFFGGAFVPASDFMANSIAYLTHTLTAKPLPVELAGLGFFNSLFMTGLALFCWTWTNLPLMCVMSAILGEVGRGWNDKDVDSPVFRKALTTGFVVYSILLVDELLTGGGLIKSSNEDAQGAYLRLAVVASLFSYMASLRPTFLESLFDRFGRHVNSKQDERHPVNHAPDAMQHSPVPARTPIIAEGAQQFSLTQVARGDDSAARPAPKKAR